MQFVRTTTSDKLILQGMLFESQKKKNNPVILHIHGMSSNCWEYDFIKRMIIEYPKNGINFLTVELRGSELLRWFDTSDGKTRLIGNAHEIFEDSVYDIAGWIEFLKKRGYNQIYLQGHSLGCAKIVYFKTQVNEPTVQGLICISPADMLGFVKEPKAREDHKRRFQEAKKLVAAGKGESLLSGYLWGYAILSAKTYLNFFQDSSNAAIFNFFDPSLGFETVKKIDVPLLAILGTKDNGVVSDPKEALDLLKKNAVNCPRFVSTLIKNAPHSFAGFEKEVVHSVVKFIGKSKFLRQSSFE